MIMKAVKALCRRGSLIAAVLAVPFGLAADDVDPPDIAAQTLHEYVYEDPEALGDMKIRAGIYLDSLLTRLSVLADSVEEAVSGVAGMPELFRESHESFLEQCHLYASFAEEIQWHHLGSGEAYWGSGYGYTNIHIAAAMVWERILAYRSFLETAASEEFGEFPVPDGREIGGW